MAVESLKAQLDSTQSKSRILIIDDSAVIRKAASKMLKEFDVVVAENGELGWNLILHDTSIAVVFTDINMPVLDGYGLIERIRTSEDEGIRNLPLIVITSEDAESGAKERVLKQGATDFISKPFNSFDLQARASAHCNYQRLQKALQEHATYEPVSGLLNPRGLQVQLEKDLSRVLREQQSLALTQIEITNFKEIYLKVGKDAADKIIQLVAKLLQQLVRKEDSVARSNLSVFTLISPAADPQAISGLAQRICDAITLIKASLKGEAITFTVSAGICALEDGGRADTQAMLSQCKQALNTAKGLSNAHIYTQIIEKQGKKTALKAISIDKLLQQLKKPEFSPSQDQLAAAREQLKPLYALLD
ncbi:MAG: diguanylate cyclase [Pseudomonadales bacterium]|nr:diguanylate cyclase [Pseudomonadales bacterium]